MPGKRILFASALIVSAAFGETKKETLYFNHADSRTLQGCLNVIRSIGDIRDATADSAGQSITVSGTAEQVSLAAWFVNEFNQAPTSRQALAHHDYPGAVGDNHLVEIFFLAYTDTPQKLQEIVNTARSVADIQRFFPLDAVQAIVARGAPAEMDTASWILDELDHPVGTLKPGPRDHMHQVTSPRQGSAAQVYVLANNPGNPLALQELVNAVRSVADIQRFFPYNAQNLIVMRGTPDQVALADWLLNQLDVPATGAAPDGSSHEYRYNPSSAFDTAAIIRVFFLNHIDSPQELQQLANDVRKSTNVPRVFPNNRTHALLVRATGDQISRAEQMIKERDQ